MLTIDWESTVANGAAPELVAETAADAGIDEEEGTVDCGAAAEVAARPTSPASLKERDTIATSVSARRDKRRFKTR